VISKFVIIFPCIASFEIFSRMGADIPEHTCRLVRRAMATVAADRTD
jgi:hypothetical protein